MGSEGDNCENSEGWNENNENSNEMETLLELITNHTQDLTLWKHRNLKP